MRFIRQAAVLGLAIASACPAGLGAEPEWIPAELAGRILLVTARVNGQGPLRMILDTGATETIVTPEAARRVGLLDPRAARGGALPLRSIEVGAARVDNLVAVMMDPPQAIPLRLDHGVDYHGLLGFSFLSRFVITIDYRHARVRLAPRVPSVRSDRSTGPGDPDPATVPFEIVDRLIYVKGRVNGQGPFTWLVDTGSAEVLMMPALARILQWPVPSGGVSRGVPVARLDTLSVGGATVSNLEAAIYQLPRDNPLVRPYDGILGYPFLSRFEVTLDYPAGRLTLQAPTPAREP